MNLKNYLSAMILAATSTVAVQAQQPLGGCWFPNDIESWTPENDPSAKFNRSRVPLATRFQEPSLMKANPAQNYEGQICNATILFNMCSLCPSQGANNFVGYQPTYWQYMDKLVYWAGAANEGLICPPPAGSIDAAHAQGVKVLGQIFFPPKAFGGEVQWVQEIVKKDADGFVYAKKLYEIAKYLGFDGWFINQETAGTGVKTATWAAFVKEFNAIADAAGDTQMEIMWYDGSTVIDAPILSAHKNASQFLDYGAVGDQRDNAKYINCTEAETFGKVYGGVQAVKAGLTGYNSELNSAFPAEGHVGSIALFCPEERAWKDNVKDLLGTADDNGEKAYAAIRKTFENEEKAWVNYDGDPSTGGNSSWRGISGAILERSAISSIPFVSNMCVGVGKHRFVNGENHGTQDWYHSGVQSVLPTWRWWIENRGDLNVSVDWEDAFNHGNCFNIAGNLSGESLMRLYKTNIALNGGAVAKVVYKTSGSAPALAVSTSSSVDPDVTLEVAKTSDVNGWTVAEYDLSSLNGKTVYMLGLKLKGNGKFDFKLGQFGVLPASFAPAAVAVENLVVTPRFSDEGGDVRVCWDYAWNDNFDHFDIYVNDLSGERTLVGQTRDEAFYIPSVVRKGSETHVNIEVVPVMKDMQQQTPAVAKAEFPKATAPVVTFALSKSYVKVGETVTITASGTGNPTAWKWTLPASLELTEGNLTDAQITVKALEEGSQIIKVEATNSVGTSVTDIEAIDVLSDESYAGVQNVALKKTIHSYSGCTNPKESPANIIDGVTNPTSTSDKWCSISPESWVIIDCQSVFRLYGFKVYDCKAGPEKNENFGAYTIEVSNDAKTWTTVVDRKNCENENIKEDYIAPTRGRYIRFSPSVNGTLRVWEFEAFGTDVVRMTVAAEPKELRVNTRETKQITVRYNLNGDDREDAFDCVATAGNNITLGKITENASASTFTIDVKGGEIIGEDEVKITVRNGGAYKETSVKVVVDDPKRPNVLSGIDATLRHYAADYDPDGAYTEYTTAALTDGNTTAEACEMVEDPSKNSEDFWAIFEAEDVWNLSKVKIYLPDANQGVNDNGNSGNVNNTISIAVGDKPNSFTKVKTFENIGDISELEYIFPEYRSARYLAIVCTLNPLFFPSLAEVEAYEQVESAVAFNEPAEMTGWIHDIVAEALPSNEHINQTIEDEDTYALYSASVNEKGGLPDNGFVRSASGKKYQIAPYNGNNALSLNKDVEAKATISFVEPSRCEQVHVLLFSGADFTAKLNVKPIYEDGSEGESVAWTVTRYDRTATGDAEVNFGIIRAGNTSSKNPLDKITDSDHFMFEKNLKVEPSKKLAALEFTSTNYYSTNILAISKTAYREAAPKHDMLMNVETPAVTVTADAAGEIIVKYDLNGNEREANFGLKATASGDAIAIGAIIEDAAASTFSIAVSAKEEYGYADIAIELVNGEDIVTSSARVVIETPAEFEGWNADVIAEATPVAQNAQAFHAEGWALYSADVKAEGAVADASRVVETANGTIFHLQPFDKENALVLEAGKPAELSMIEPQQCEELLVLAFAHADVDLDIIVTYTDGTTSEAMAHTVLNPTEDTAAKHGLGAVKDGETAHEFAADFNRGLYEFAIAPDHDKHVKNISFQSNTAAAKALVLAMAWKERVEGISDATAVRQIEAIYNLHGMKVANPSAGIYVVRYTDGTTAKIFVK